MDSSIVVVVLGALVLLASRWRHWRRRTVSVDHLRGRQLRNLRTAELGEPAARGDHLQLGRLRLPEAAGSQHLAVVGATGSGKTILQRLLMQSVLPHVVPGSRRRALIYDPKQDLVSILAGLRLTCPVHLLHPLDVRSVSWDLAADVATPASALQVASMLVPESRQDSNPFFSHAARHLVYGVILGFIVQRSRWNLREVLLTLRDRERLEAHLDRDEVTRFLLQYFAHDATLQNILSTLLAVLAPYEVIAAAWHHARESISLTRWMEGESILVLGNDEVNRTAVDALNRLIFRRVAELVLAQPESATEGRTWFFLDEVREAGRLDSLSRLLTQGRSKRAAVVLGFQDIAGLQSVYGREVAEELVGQCSMKVILRLNSPETAAWASRLFGSREVVEARHGSSRDVRAALAVADRRGESISHGVVTRRLVLDSELFDLPVTSPATGLTGYFLTPQTGLFRDHLPGDWIARELMQRDEGTQDFIPRPVGQQFLKAWTKAPAPVHERIPLGARESSRVNPGGSGL